MPKISNYLFSKHIEKCKISLEAFEEREVPDLKDDFKKEAEKVLYESNNFLNSIDAFNYSDFDDFNNKAENFNDELNRILETFYIKEPDELYTYNRFIEYFHYDKTMFNDENDEIDINDLDTLDEYFDCNTNGVALNNMGSYQYAIDKYSEAIDLIDYYALAYYNRGLARSNLGFFKKAIKDYDKAIELSKNYKDAYYNRGFAKNNAGLHKEAIEDYNKVIELDTNNIDAYNNRGVSKNYLQLFDEAIKDLGLAQITKKAPFLLNYI